jgi:response regulator RpfG family c-di-GMP phosphodiesterase
MIVLTVDDSDVNLAVYRGILSKIAEVEIVGYTSPREALAWSETHRVDVVVVDYHMPEIDGLAFIDRFRRFPSAEHALVIMITGDGEREIRHHALESGGANDFLTKPIDRIEFNSRIRNLLELAKARRELSDRAKWLDVKIEVATSSIVAREIETIVRLTRAAEFRDDVTGMHVIRVGHMCAALARNIGLPDEECKMLLLAAPMHDIGKVATPDGILLKPGKLTVEEFDIMKRHTTIGYEILKDSESPMLQCAAEIALTHHERFDGTGYPRALSGSSIPLSGRLCSIVDVFDALTSKRPYKEAWSFERALAMIESESGTQFDPDVNAAFCNSLDEILAIKKRFSDATAGSASLREAFEFHEKAARPLAQA